MSLTLSPVIGDEGVPIYQPVDAVGNLVSNSCDDHAAIAMAHKDDLTETVLGQIVDDRLDGIWQSNGF